MEKEFLKLKDGNNKFVNGKNTVFNLKFQREVTSRGQNPHTVVVTCSDSRVVPEYIFDCGLGELFVVRIAGNVLDRISLETVEFAVASFEIKQIVVMGHTNCGAIMSVIKGISNNEYFGGLFQKLSPIVEESKRRFNSEKEILNHSIVANVLNQVKFLMNSKLISEKFKKNEITILPALYNLETGFVEFLQISEDEPFS